MRREGVLTGYVWDRKSGGKVKVKGKRTNASKASGRCTHTKCPSCHEQPASKAKSKTKGRNKRALFRLLVDDEWAFCKRTPAGRRIKAVPSRVVDDDSYDACHAEANPMGHEVNVDDLNGADDANDDHDISVADDVSDAGILHAHDDVRDVRMLVFGMDGKLYTVTYPMPVVGAVILKKVAPDVNPGICAKANDVIVDDAGDANDDHDISVANDVSDVGMHAHDDVNYGCPATMAHAKDDVALEEEEETEDDASGNQESHAMMVHAAEDDDDVYGDEDANNFQSLISGLVNVGWPTRNNNEEVVEVECEENSLSGDWCYVASSDAIDDWYLC